MELTKLYDCTPNIVRIVTKWIFFVNMEKMDEIQRLHMPLKLMKTSMHTNSISKWNPERKKTLVIFSFEMTPRAITFGIRVDGGNSEEICPAMMPISHGMSRLCVG